MGITYDTRNLQLMWHGALTNSEGWAAKNTNLRDYDGWIFEKINSQRVTTNDEFIQARKNLKAGDSVTFTLRNPQVHFFACVLMKQNVGFQS